MNSYNHNSPKLKAVAKTIYAIARNNCYTLEELYEDIQGRLKPEAFNKSIFMNSLARDVGDYSKFKNREVTVQAGKLVLLPIHCLPLDKREL